MKNNAASLLFMGLVLCLIGPIFLTVNAGHSSAGDIPFDFKRFLVWTVFVVPLQLLFMLSSLWLMRRKKVFADTVVGSEEPARVARFHMPLMYMPFWKRCLITLATFQVVGVLPAMFTRIGDSRTFEMSFGQFCVSASLGYLIAGLGALLWLEFCKRKLRAFFSETQLALREEM